MVTVIGPWVVLQGVIWALIYYQRIPGGFMCSSGVNFTNAPDVAETLYVSFVTLTILGHGDVVVTDPWIRAAFPRAEP